jgi:hypothetical protein
MHHACRTQVFRHSWRHQENVMRFVQIEILPAGKALVDIDKLTHAVPQEGGSRLFLGAQHLDVPHTLDEMENILAGRDRTDDGEHSSTGFRMG